jgi:hypothetical protein
MAQSHAALPQQTRQGLRYVAKIPFDARGMWSVHLLVEGSEGVGAASLEVEVTPPYPGIVTTLACLIPFAVIGGLWAAGVVRSRKHQTVPSSSQSRSGEG